VGARQGRVLWDPSLGSALRPRSRPMRIGHLQRQTATPLQSKGRPAWGNMGVPEPPFQSGAELAGQGGATQGQKGGYRAAPAVGRVGSERPGFHLEALPCRPG
jgi:hypothetical protein